MVRQSLSRLCKNTIISSVCVVPMMMILRKKILGFAVRMTLLIIVYFWLWKFKDTLTSLKFHLNQNESVCDFETNQRQGGDTIPVSIICIEHSQYTDIDAVGLQIWNGALLLADYVINKGSSVFHATNVLELSSGTGLLSIIASIFCKHVICTDRNEQNILKTIEKNFNRNKRLVKATYGIYELNFFKPWSQDVTNFVKETEHILVSEIIYDNEITDGFIQTLKKIFDLQPAVKIYMAIEKRFVFTLSNLRVEAVHYDYFFQTITELRLPWTLQKLNTDFPRYFFEYNRSKELELWKISWK